MMEFNQYLNRVNLKAQEFIRKKEYLAGKDPG